MDNKVEILKTPIFENINYKKFLTDDLLLQQIVDNFTFVLENNIDKDKLTLFYNNISTLKVDDRIILYERLFSVFNDNVTTGQYYIDENLISVLPLKNSGFLCKYIGMDTEEYIANLCHELLHMSSTYVDKINDMVYSGFSQIGKTNIGIAIDDAYTEMLVYRLFDLDKNYMSYNYEISVTNLIENIVGINRMTELYFNANLYDLVIELEKYNNREDIINFLENFDSIYVLFDRKKRYEKDIIYYHNEITSFLIKTYMNKLLDDKNNNIISCDEYDIMLDDYISNVHNIFELLDISVNKKKIKDKLFY